MSANLWTHTFLDGMRNEGDPAADAAVAAVLAEGGPGAVHHMLRTLSANQGAASDELPPAIVDYLVRTAALPATDAKKIARGEEIFRILGPEILMVLGFYGLPASYASRKGAQVLHRTAALTRDPVRRLFTTARFVVDVMAKGGLRPDGRGVRAARQVRLTHAAVRQLLTCAPALPWDASLGLPLNQEDLAGTLMTFSTLTLAGLARLGVELTPADREAFLHVWQVVGRILGVREELIPADVAEARALTAIIHERQLAPSPEGRALTAALLEGYRGLLPARLRWVPASLMRFFLDRDPFDGRDVAEMVGVPRAAFAARVARFAVEADVLFARRRLTCVLADELLACVSPPLIERRWTRPTFAIPQARLGWVQV